MATKQSSSTEEQKGRVLATIDAKAGDFLYAFERWYHCGDLNVWELVKEQMVRLIIRKYHREEHGEELWKHYKGELLDLLKDECANATSLTYPHLEHIPFNLDTAEPLKGRCWNDKIHWIDDDGNIQTRPTNIREFWQHRINDLYPNETYNRNNAKLFEEYASESMGFKTARSEQEKEEAQNNILLMLEVLGMILSDNRFQKMVHCGKTPNSGKSTFLRIAELLVGEENAKPIKSQRLDTDQSVPARLVGKMLITAPEMAAQPTANVNDFIKAATGGDRMEMRRLYEQDALDAQITGIFLAASNRTTSYVGFNEKPDAMLRRLICIPFTNALKGKPDTDLAQKIFDTGADAIRLEAIKAYAEVVASGGEFTIGKKSRQMSEEMCQPPHGEFAKHYRHAHNRIVLNGNIRDHYAEWQGFEGGILADSRGFNGIVHTLANLHDGEVKGSIRYRTSFGESRISKGIKHIERIPEQELEDTDEYNNT